MTDITRNGIFPPEILLEIFMLAIQTSPQNELLACALVCTSWYYCAMDIIRPALRKGIYFNTNNMIQNFNAICSYRQMSRLNIIHQVPAVHIDIREYSALYNNIAKIWYTNCWAVIYVPFDDRDIELQSISKFLKSFKLGYCNQLTRLAVCTQRHLFPRNETSVNDLLSLLSTFVNLSEIYLEWNVQNYSIINIFNMSYSIRTVTITKINQRGMKDLATTISNWPLLQNFTLKYTGRHCDLSPIINSLAESCNNLSSLIILVNYNFRDESKTELVKLINTCGKRLTRFVLRGIDLDFEVLHTLATLTPNLEVLDISWDDGAMNKYIPCGTWSTIKLMRLAFPYGCINVDWLLGILTNCNGLEYDMLLSEQIMRDNRITKALQACTHKIIDDDYWIPDILNL